ncbi:triose-phosphate isomerase [Helicobacter turcicus]|uniref:Triosephosphate isomerase n=1 Tax=Helicobacter turcicus TaxID=2867412 RepID=A0ABS7JM56_9HELI|nr:triose-phosphate isomerase [Helicobacter turcicus]MBX7490461.1 triose-phosphate isomerase [Helicobacter turcicus]MBX7545321.1 triose-phosphate isomerase [Helicobacter turcicus]
MKIIASNFKTNHTRRSTQEFCTTLESFLNTQKNPNKITIFPPTTALLDNTFKHFSIGAQNAYFTQCGSFTGEIGLEQLHEFQIQSLLIGHSERREILGESQEFCAQKFAYFARQDFEIFYCIGESLETKNKGLDSTLVFLESQLKGIALDYPKLIIAYEPIWAIGSGISATLEEITQIHTRLKQKLGKIPLLYGGSVKPQNVSEILSLDGVDGVLVGSASWEIQSFCKILENSF